MCCSQHMHPHVTRCVKTLRQSRMFTLDMPTCLSKRFSLRLLACIRTSLQCHLVRCCVVGFVGGGAISPVEHGPNPELIIIK